MTQSFSAADCPACHWPLVISWGPPAGPVSDVFQEALGGSVEILYRVFDPSEWLTEWAWPLTIVAGSYAEWRTVAEWWRVARAKREGRFLSLAEINEGWGGGGEQ